MRLLPALREGLPQVVSLLLILAGIFIVFRYLDPEVLREFVLSAGIWAPLALIAAKASTIIVAPLGGAPLYPLAGALFGFYWGYLYLIIGDTVGLTVAFFLSRFFGRRIVNYFFPDTSLVNRVLRALGTLKGYIIAQLAFISVPELVAYAAGLSRLHYGAFILVATVISIVPRALLVAMGSFLAAGFNSLLFVGMVLLYGLAFGAGVYVFSRYLRTLDPDLRATMKDDETLG